MATLKEVAELTGVAPITVSRVVNNPETVKEKTRLKVEAAMKQLKYTPNIAAKSLATNRCGVIDVFIPETIELSNPFVMYFIAGISKVLSEHYYSFLILRNRKREHLCDGYIVTGLLKNEIQDFSWRFQPRIFFPTYLSVSSCSKSKLPSRFKAMSMLTTPPMSLTFFMYSVRYFPSFLKPVLAHPVPIPLL